MGGEGAKGEGEDSWVCVSATVLHTARIFLELQKLPD